ncbi:hypothetical protein ASD46_09420 [Rhizobium sp. Root491]|nr:hypothetical protein ASD46_09420 [Rhizobium sp. Root491]
MIDRAAEFLPKAIVGKSEPPIRRWLYDFQGLVGGILALAAGVITIVQMRSTDREAADRHNEAMRHAREGNKNALERALNPTVRSLCSVKYYLDTAEKAVRSRNTFELQKEELLNNSWLVGTAYRDTLEALNREQFVVGSALFPGMLAYKVAYLKKLVENDLEFLRTLENHFGRGFHNLPNRQVRQRLDDCYGPFFEMTVLLPEVITMMEEIASKHDISVS